MEQEEVDKTDSSAADPKVLFEVMKEIAGHCKFGLLVYADATLSLSEKLMQGNALSLNCVSELIKISKQDDILKVNQICLKLTDELIQMIGTFCPGPKMSCYAKNFEEFQLITPQYFSLIIKILKEEEFCPEETIQSALFTLYQAVQLGRMVDDESMKVLFSFFEKHSDILKALCFRILGFTYRKRTEDTNLRDFLMSKGKEFLDSPDELTQFFGGFALGVCIENKNILDKEVLDKLIKVVKEKKTHQMLYNAIVCIYNNSIYEQNVDINLIESIAELTLQEGHDDLVKYYLQGALYNAVYKMKTLPDSAIKIILDEFEKFDQKFIMPQLNIISLLGQHKKMSFNSKIITNVEKCLDIEELNKAAEDTLFYITENGQKISEECLEKVFANLHNAANLEKIRISLYIIYNLVNNFYYLTPERVSQLLDMTILDPDGTLNEQVEKIIEKNTENEKVLSSSAF